MEQQELLNIIKNKLKGGCNYSIHKVKELKKGDNVVIKHSIFIVRVGIKFPNLKVNEGRKTGELPWGKWVEGLYPWVLEHKGNYYLRVYNSSLIGNHYTYYVYNGEEISKERAIELVGEDKSQKSDCYSVKFDNIVSIA